MLNTTALIIAGGLGAVSRACIDVLGSRHLPARPDVTTTGMRLTIPWPTTAINVGGSFVAGMVAGVVSGHGAADTLAGILAIGYLGAFTTFSTAMLQTVELLIAGARGRAVVHAVLPLGASVGAAAVGWTLLA